LQSQIKQIEEGLTIEIPDSIAFSSLYDTRKAVIRFFEEKRLAQITQPKAATSLSIEKEEAAKNFHQQLGNALEQHLVNLKTRASLAITEENNRQYADSINQWLANFEKNLKLLFEDEALKLTFTFGVDKTGFTINQSGKPPFAFQTLSAGYRAIFDIYAELLMRTEYFDVLPENLTGVVFIDEIDSHLHVSLQRLILPFFTQSFPKIQFIVTTHSPFVLMSTPDTVVYDLAKNEPITGDLSYYTYSAVMKGLWNVKPISIRLEKSIKEIAQIVNSQQKDYRRLQELVEQTNPYEDALDGESKVFLMLGMETLEEGGVDV
jgi:predicted ATP-dependent endonuclease of OLD family